jgi:hypothetical protein
MDLGPSERIIWQGQPAQGLRFSPQDVFAVPFAVFWLLMVLAIFGLILSGGPTQVDPFAYVILPIFIMVGIYMLIGRFIVDRAARRRINYYLTNQRALIETGLFRLALSSISLAALPEMKFRAGRKGRGTIQFGSPPALFGMIPSSWPGARQFLPPMFEDVEDGQRIFQLALSAQREAQARR